MKLKKKNHLEILSFYTCVPWMKIIWCMVPEIWSATNDFSHFGSFLSFYPPNNPQNQNFEKWKNTWRYHLFTLVYHKLQLWCFVHEIWTMTDILSFWAIFCPFTRLTTQKVKILKICKKLLKISSFNTRVPNT